MSNIPYCAPQSELSSFNCPYCRAYASQDWKGTEISDGSFMIIQGLRVAICSHCRKYSVWRNGIMISPDYIAVDPPNEDIEQEIKDDYNEAAAIMSRSPRASAALLRLAVQKLCGGQLAAEGKDINDQIANLVQRGLLPQVQQSLDALRVIGNEAVHPGTIDLIDDVETATSLFGLINIIAEQMITHPKQAAEVFAKIPANKQAQISKRDSSTS